MKIRPTLALLLTLAAAIPSLAQESGATKEIVGMRGRVAGKQAVIEVVGLPSQEAQGKIRQAFAVLANTETQISEAVAKLNHFDGKGRQKVDPEILQILGRSLEFCLWSDGTSGPLGGKVSALWQQAANSGQQPDPGTLSDAAQSAACSKLVLDPAHHAVALAAGSKLDLSAFTTGFAIDQAVAKLTKLGVQNFRVTIGEIRRALGPGPEGHGWISEIPVFAGLAQPLSPVHLHGESIAVVSAHSQSLNVGSQRIPAFFDQTTGRPESGTEAVVVITHTALDAEALASSLMILGNRVGELRLGTIDPKPAVLWVLGSGQGTPLLDFFHWSQRRLKQ